MSNEIEAGTNVDLTLHREPEGASDKFAHGVVKFLRFLPTSSLQTAMAIVPSCLKRSLLSQVWWGDCWCI